MRSVCRIFKQDFKAVWTNRWAAIIVVGVMLIPALYAWLNIDSNWDPYGATRGIQIAVANCDEGSDVKGMDLNIGGMIVAKLAENDAIGWQFVSEEEAMEGVKEGRYYAAVVIPEEFSQSVGSITQLVIEKPHVLYYVNEKKNAIAPKITNAGINAVQVQVNQAIVETAASVLSTLSSETMGTLEGQTSDAADQIVDALTDLDQSLSDDQTLIDALDQATQSLDSSLDAVSALTPAVNQTVDHLAEAGSSAQDLLESNHSTAQLVSSSLETSLQTARGMAVSLQQMAADTDAWLTPAASNASDEASMQLTSIGQRAAALNTYNHQLIDVFSTLNTATDGRLSKLQDLVDQLEKRSDQLDAIQKKIESIETTAAAGKSLASSQKEQLQQMAQELAEQSDAMDQLFQNEVQPQIETTYAAIDQALSDLSSVEADASWTSALDTSADSMQDALHSTQSALAKTQQMIGAAKQKVQASIDSIEQAKTDEKIQHIEALLARDPELVAAFMKEPVSIETVSVYPIANYGSGMAPFYTTLAIWVGALVNCAVFKTKVKADGKQAWTPNEEYFGRYLFFGIVSVCQALIICLGDLWLLKIQCLHPVLFCLMGAAAAISFSLLMYTLTVSFGDVGKAIAVVLMVLQVAGSGGTFPIDILPKFYQFLYPFFPFNYAINGMRECIGGIWQNAYWIDVAKELLFIPVSLLIGLVLRKPIVQMKSYIEERIETTGFIG